MTLDALDAQLRSGCARILAVLDGLSDEAANRKPAPDVWSVAEVVNHLNRLAADYLPVLDQAYASAPAGRATGDVPLGLVGGLFVRVVGPTGRPTKTFGTMQPPPSGPAASALDVAVERAAFEADMARFLALADRARRTAPVRAGLPILPVVRLRGVALLAAMAAHVHRHADQIEHRAALGTAQPAR